MCNLLLAGAQGSYKNFLSPLSTCLSLFPQSITNQSYDENSAIYHLLLDKHRRHLKAAEESQSAAALYALALGEGVAAQRNLMLGDQMIPQVNVTNEDNQVIQVGFIEVQEDNSLQ